MVCTLPVKPLGGGTLGQGEGSGPQRRRVREGTRAGRHDAGLAPRGASATGPQGPWDTGLSTSRGAAVAWAGPQWPPERTLPWEQQAEGGAEGGAPGRGASWGGGSPGEEPEGGGGAREGGARGGGSSRGS